MNMTRRAGGERGHSLILDTTFVLFFLSIEFGRALSAFTLDGALLAVTLLMVLVLPYFLPRPDERPNLARWLLQRGCISGLAIVIGLMFSRSLGVVIPETFRFLPMSLLIVTAMISCYIQFYSFAKFRLAK